MKWSKAKLLGRVSNRKAIISLMVVVALVATSAVTAVALSPQVASIESTTPELSILNMTHDPAEALVDESVVWTVVVEVQEPAQLGKGLLFTWDWDDGSYTVYHMKSLISEPIAVDVQTHAWSAAGVYDVVVSVYDGYGPQKSRFHNVSATTPFIVKDAEPNTPPIASFYLWPEEGTVDTVFMFNANSSYDFEDPVESLLVRWDWESDSIWDTDYSGDQAAEHVYAAAGDYLVTLEAMDTGGLTDTAWGNLTVVASTTLTPHDPIIIIGDTDFVPKNGVVRGAGTYDDPYVIAGWNITPTGGNGITVLGTTAYFTILDTLITGNIDTCTYGVYLDSVAHATLRGLTISGFWMGIHAVKTADLTVTLCDVTWSSWGLFALRCGSIYVTENEISHNIVGMGNHEGIMVQETDYAYIASNDLVDNWDGVFLYIVSFGWIHNNTMRDNGIGIQALYSGCIVFGNSIASKVIGIILVDCPDTSVESNSITTDPSVYDSYTGIEFMSCSGLSVSLNVIDSYHTGIRTSPSSYAYPDSDNVTISWNRISYCDVVAVSAYYVLDLTVTANTFLSSGTGIYVDSSAMRVKVYHNDFVDNSVQAQENLLCAGNEWDDGYPSGGNYWSDYQGTDEYGGDEQTIPGSDGIGDTPYVLASGSQDSYPLMEPFWFQPANAPPVANFTVSPQTGTVDTVFVFDASSSWDSEDDVSVLLTRWDWESDGWWDTSYTTDKIETHQFAYAGYYLVTLEVTDSGGLLDIAYTEVTVQGTGVLTPHAPIYIVGDADFAATAAEESWQGQGTEDDPYVIELLDITGMAAPNAIWVEDTRVHFVIRDCWLEGDSSALRMYNVTNAAAINNTFTTSPFYSIYCERSYHLWIEDNIILGGSHCIGVLDSGNVYLGGNTVEDSGWWSLWIAYSYSVILRDNRFYGSGIEITGWAVSQWTSHDIDSSNSLNGAPIYYFKDQMGGVVPSYAGQVILANCTWMYVSTYLTGSILLGFSSYNWIDQCSVRSVHYGITLMSSPDNFIMSTSVADCYYGIYIVKSPRCLVNDTMVSGCAHGIWVHLSDGTWISSNEVTGSEWTGVFLYSSSYCEVHQNVISESFQRGIRLTDARSNHITHNDFVDNWIQAYEEYESTGNLWDDGYPAGGNYWSDYDGVDYLSGVDQTEPGSDGIGDTPYALVSGSQDNYPLMEPFASPQVNTAPTANFSVSANPWEVWEIFEFDASSSWDYEDDLTELQVRWDWENDGAWDTPWSYDKMAYHIFEEPGEHFVALEVVDTGGLTGTSVVGIYVPDVIEPPPPNTFYLPFATTDVVFDPERPYAYITDKYAMSLYFVNLTDGSVDQTFVFQYMTESLAMTPDGSRLFVALLTREHDPCWFEGQVGYIASIDLETQVKDREFMIDEDPFDLLATSNGHLVVSPGSGQWDYIRTYDATDGTPIGSAFIRHMSRLSMHPSESIVYAADTDVSPSDITRFDLSRSGDISLAGDSPYHGDYEMAGDVWINPLGDSLIVRGGHVLTAGLPISQDMYYVTTMTTATPISDVEFDLANGLVLSLEGAQLCWYDIESYEALGNTSTGSDMEFLGLGGGTVYCVDAEWSSTTIIWFDGVSA